MQKKGLKKILVIYNKEIRKSKIIDIIIIYKLRGKFYVMSNLQ